MVQKFVSILLILLICSVQLDAKEKSKKKKKIKKNTIEKVENFTQLNEILLGRAIAAHVSKKYKLLKNAESSQFLNNVGNQLVNISNPGNLYFFFGILDSEEQLYFPLIGGYILISKGLLKKMNSESELAFLLGKGIASVNMSHEMVRSKTKIQYFGVEFESSELTEKNPPDVKKIQSVSMVIEKGFSNKNSFESETASLILISTAGYNTKNAINTINVIHQENMVEKRKEELTNFMNTNDLSSGRAGDLPKFESFKESLKGLDDDLEFGTDSTK